MGLLVQEDGVVDYQAVSDVVESIAKWWKINKEPDWGFEFFAVRSKIEYCSDFGSRLFKSGYFAENPSPFKRVAAFLVICRLHPFFCYKFSEGIKFETPTEEIAWNVRLLALSIPSILANQEVLLENKRVPLPAWTEFPSLHYLLEFFAWLRWITRMQEHQPKFSADEWQEIYLQRVARMVLACSLMIEASYYAAENRSQDSIRNLIMPCLNDLDENLRIDLYYDIKQPNG
jgi:hypothetical protein